MKILLPTIQQSPSRSTGFITIRREPPHKRFRYVAFSRKLVEDLKLVEGDLVVVYLDGKSLKFKLRPTKKDEVAGAHRLRADSKSGLAIITSSLPDPEYAAGRYATTVAVDWVTIGLDEPGAATGQLRRSA